MEGSYVSWTPSRRRIAMFALKPTVKSVSGTRHGVSWWFERRGFLLVLVLAVDGSLLEGKARFSIFDDI